MKRAVFLQSLFITTTVECNSVEVIVQYDKLFDKLELNERCF